MSHDLKGLLKRSNFLVDLVRSIKKWQVDLVRSIKKWQYKSSGWETRNNLEILEKLAAFSPNSTGSLRSRSALTLQAGQQVFPLLSALLSASGRAPIRPVPITAVYPDAVLVPETQELASLFSQYGSDKSSLHDYHLLYGPLLAPCRDRPLRVLEIGVGTNNPDVVSTMGQGGKPGASLRAFRDFLPNAQIFGADVDKRVLFSEERIKTFFVDQTKQASFGDLTVALGCEEFDLIIDDGLHSPNANLATTLFALSALKRGGTFVVEDISDHAVSVWQTIAAILGPAYAPTLIHAKDGLLFKITAPHR